jgi:hypothetical protein
MYCFDDLHWFWMNLDMRPVPLEMISPYPSKECNNAPIGCHMRPRHLLESWTLDIEILSAILVESILFGPRTSSIGKFILSSFRAYVERPNPIWYASCTSIWSRGGPGLRVGLEVKLWNSELDWISTLMCTSSCLSDTLLVSHLSSSSSPWFLTIIKLLGSNRFSK